MSDEDARQFPNPPIRLDGSRVHEKLDAILSELRNTTEALVGLTARLSSTFVILIAIIAMGISSWLLILSKISAEQWLIVFMSCLAQYLGEGVGKIVEKLIPWSKKPSVEIAKHSTKMILILGLSLCFFDISRSLSFAILFLALGRYPIGS